MEFVLEEFATPLSYCICFETILCYIVLCYINPACLTLKLAQSSYEFYGSGNYTTDMQCTSSLFGGMSRHVRVYITGGLIYRANISIF